MAWTKTPAGRRRDTQVYGNPEYQRNRKTILRNAAGRCQIRTESICTHRATEVDHLTPVSQGGGHDLRNLRAACGPCHRHKTAAEGGGFRLAHGDPDPAPRTGW
jgi:5-methylcytosine-specific restriction protein A